MDFIELHALEVRKDDCETPSLQDVSLRNYLASFARDTSLQGLPNLAKSRGLIKKAFWLCAIIVSCGGLYWQLGAFFEKFLEFRATTSVHMESSTRMEHPAITICNNNPVSDDFACDLYLKAINFQGNKTEAPCGRRAGYNTTWALQQVSMLSQEEKKASGHQLVDVILSCQFNNKPCNVTTEFGVYHWSSTFGNCWTFNFGHLAENSPSRDPSNLWATKYGTPEKPGIKITTIPGDVRGLSLKLYVDPNRYMSKVTQSGWRILIHNQTEMPFPDEEGVFVAPGTSTRIGIRKRHYVRLGMVDNGLYVANYSTCVEDKNRFINDFPNSYSKLMEVGYSYKACTKSCYQQKVVEKCGCYNYLFPRINGTDGKPVRPCVSNNPTDMTCHVTLWGEFTGDPVAAGCVCPYNCEAHYFDSTISALKWPMANSRVLPTVCEEILKLLSLRINKSSSDMIDSLLAADYARGDMGLYNELASCAAADSDGNWQSMANEVLGNNFAEVKIFIETFDFECVIEQQLFEIADLVAYLGGTIGLFFGFTMLTLCEYIVLAVELAAIGIAKAYAGLTNRNLVGARRANSKLSLISSKSISSVSPIMDSYGNVEKVCFNRQDLYPDASK